MNFHILEAEFLSTFLVTIFCMHKTSKHVIVDCVAFSYMYVCPLVDSVVHTFYSKHFMKTSLLVRECNLY